MIEVEFKPKSYELSVSGHANYGEEGKDIVCAAVSILFYTLAGSLEESEMLDGQLEKEIEKGKSSIRCVPKAKYESNVAMVFWTILNGLQLLADAYPENVALKIR